MAGIQAIPGTVNTVQNGFSLAGSAPKTTQPINWSAINTTAPKTTVSPISQVSAAAPAVTPTQPFNISGSAPAQQSINWGAINTKPAPTTQPQMANYPLAPQPQAPVPSAPPVSAPGNPGLINPQALNPQVSFPGIVGSLAQTSQQGTSQGQQYTGQVAQTAQGNIPIGQQAQDITNKYASFINPALKEAAGEEIGNLTGGGLFPVGQGIASQIASATGQELQGLSSQESQQLVGVGQQLSAQQQAQTGLGTAAGLAQTQQQLTQSGLGTAGQLTAPSVAGYGQTSFNPLTQQYGTGGGAGGQPIGPNDPLYSAMQTYAQLLANNQGSAVPSFISGNPALQAQLVQMAQQINPGFNYNAASGAGAAQQANAQLAVGGVPAANFQVYQGGLQQLYSIGQQLQNVTNLGNLTLGNATGGTVNPFDLRYANQTIQEFRNQLSSPAQATFNSNLAAFQSAAGALLATAPGETPTDITSKVGAIADGSMSLGALKAMLDAAQSEGAIRYQSQLGVVQGAHQQLINPGSGTAPAATSGTSGVTPSGITYTIE